MKLAEATLLARALMDKHGLWGWQVVVTDATMVNTQVFGYIVSPSLDPHEPQVIPIEQTEIVIARCVRPMQMLMFSGPVLAQASVLGVREFVLHEIAHALTDGDHNEAWVAMARRIGCTGRVVLDLNHYVEAEERAS